MDTQHQYASNNEVHESQSNSYQQVQQAPTTPLPVTTNAQDKPVFSIIICVIGILSGIIIIF